MTIADLVRVATADAKAAGFHDQMTDFGVPPRYQAMIRSALVASEAFEALDVAKKQGVLTPEARSAIGEELADVLIRAGDFAGTLGIDLERAVLDKLAFNRTRGKRFGTPDHAPPA